MKAKKILQPVYGIVTGITTVYMLRSEWPETFDNYLIVGLVACMVSCIALIMRDMGQNALVQNKPKRWPYQAIFVFIFAMPFVYMTDMELPFGWTHSEHPLRHSISMAAVLTVVACWALRSEERKKLRMAAKQSQVR